VRVIVHDFSGHPSQVQLSRALASRGHQVLHVHSASYNAGKAAVARRESDPKSFAVERIDLGGPSGRYSQIRRVCQKLAYGHAFAKLASRFRPDIVLSGDNPLLAQAWAARWCRRAGVPWVSVEPIRTGEQNEASTLARALDTSRSAL
jgi:colanic acid biosynthesis glycosyl transferase WcaI